MIYFMIMKGLRGINVDAVDGDKTNAFLKVTRESASASFEDITTQNKIGHLVFGCEKAVEYFLSYPQLV